MRQDSEIRRYIGAIQKVLTDALLTPKYRAKPRVHVTEGHCYAASEALYYLLGGKGSVLVPQVSSWESNGEKLTHWYLKNSDTGEILDPTVEQFLVKKEAPPYDKGKGCGFLTKQPSRRAQKILDMVSKLIDA